MAKSKNRTKVLNLYDERRNNKLSMMFLLLLVAVCLLSKCGKLLVGIDIDEQYSISLAYRIASGDAMVFEMWEPHQTSALIPALFLKLFITVTGGTEYSVIFLRFVGGIIQGIISLYWFATFRNEFGRRKAVLSALLLFAVLPKWIQSPEFANQEIWWLLLVLIFAYRGIKGHICNWIGAGLAMSLCVLSYPSTFIVFLSFVIFLTFRKMIKEMAVMTATCVLCGVAVFLGICYQSSISKVLSFAKYVLTDSSHAERISDKLIGYLNDGVEIFSLMALYFLVSVLLIFAVSKAGEICFSVLSITEMMLLVSIVDQYRLWICKGYANPHPSVHFVIAFILFCLLLAKKEKITDFDKLLLISSLASFFAVATVSNLDLKASIVHLFPGFVGFILLSSDEDKYCSFVRYSWIMGVVLSYVFLVRFSGGYHKDVFMIKQKALYGPAKGIYCEYMDGYSYNENAKLLINNIAPQEEMFLLGDNDLLYMISNAQVCSASIISTPIFDEKYTDYFDYTGKVPSKIVVEKSFLKHNEGDYSIFLEWMKDRYHQVAENDYIMIWKHVND